MARKMSGSYVIAKLFLAGRRRLAHLVSTPFARFVGTLVTAFLLAFVFFQDRDNTFGYAGQSVVLPFLAVLGVLRIFTPRGYRRIVASQGMLFALLAFVFVVSVEITQSATIVLRYMGTVFVFWAPLWTVAQLASSAWSVADVLVVLVSSAIGLAGLNAVGPTVLGRIVLPEYNLDIDHRPTRNVMFTNEDGVQPPLPASTYTEDGFNIVFLGDSFTEGGGPLKWGDKPFPALLEEELRGLYPSLDVRVANFGWSSSSPVLQLRQLRDIGKKYHPKVIVQALDMTDFHNDLNYDAQLHAALRPKITIFRALQVRFLGVVDYFEWLRRHWTWGPWVPKYHRGVQLPEHIFFFAFQPLQESEQYFRVTRETILQTEAYARTLGARYMLVIIPRYQQYNRAECPHDASTADMFPPDDRFVLTPFEYFADMAKTVSFPIRSLLEPFRQARGAPTVFENNPHFSPFGNSVAAKTISRFLMEDGFLPGLPTEPIDGAGTEGPEAADLGASLY